MRYLTKGDLLDLLGDDANKFTAFMLDPEAYGLTTETVTSIKIAKQKFDWTNGLNLDLPEIKSLVALLTALGVVRAGTQDLLDTVIDSPQLDSVVVHVNALDDVTTDNIAGVVPSGNGFMVDASFINTTKGTEHTESLWFDAIPSQDELNASILLVVRRLRSARV